MILSKSISNPFKIWPITTRTAIQEIMEMKGDLSMIEQSSPNKDNKSRRSQQQTNNRIQEEVKLEQSTLGKATRSLRSQQQTNNALLERQSQKHSHRQPQKIGEEYPFKSPEDQPEKQQQTSQQTQLRQIEYRVTKWYCPCGKLMINPIHFFTHVKEEHNQQTLQKVMQQEIITSFANNYPNNTLSEFISLECLEDNRLDERINRITSKFTLNDLQNVSVFQRPSSQGSYADLADHMIREFGTSQVKKLYLTKFFLFLKLYVTKFMGKDCWEVQSPKNLPMKANDLFVFFRSITLCKSPEFDPHPLKVVDVKNMIAIVGNWMFLNKWTNDKLIDTSMEYEPQPEKARQTNEALRLPWTARLSLNQNQNEARHTTLKQMLYTSQ